MESKTNETTVYSPEQRREDEHCLIAIFLCYPELIETLNFKRDYFSVDFYKRIFDFLMDPNAKENGIYNVDVLCKYVERDEVNSVFDIAAYNIYHKSKREFALFYGRSVLEEYKKEKIEQLNIALKVQSIDSDEFYKRLNEVQSLTVEPEVEELNDEVIDKYVMDEGLGLSIDKFDRLSSKLRIELTDVITVAATSGFGKSAFLLNIYSSLSQNAKGKYKCQYFNVEVAPKMITKRLLAIASDHMVDDFRKENMNQEYYKKARKKIQNGSLVHSGSISIEELKSKALCNLDEDKINVIFVDHIGLIGVDDKQHSKTEYDRVTYCMKELRNMALDNNLIVFIASQFDRGSVKNDNLSMFSLKSSGEIENSSTHVLLLKNSPRNLEEDDKGNKKGFSHLTEVMIDVAKNRNGSVGVLDYYTFNKQKQIFIEKV